MWTKIVALWPSFERMGHHSVGENSSIFHLESQSSQVRHYINYLMFQTLMGVFYYIRAVALLEDLPFDEKNPPHSIEDFVIEVEKGYTLVRQYSWISKHYTQK